MDSIRFTSRLTIDDVSLFLKRFDRFKECKLDKNSFIKNAELSLCFTCNDVEFYFSANDFSMRIAMMNECGEKIIQEKIPNDDDWFCFLKSKFGREYQEHFADLFNAKSIMFDSPKYISHIPYDEIKILIYQILSDYYIQNNRVFLRSEVDVMEVESFFRSERRFLITRKISGESFYLRMSDYMIVCPRIKSKSFKRFMVGKFGEGYLQTYYKNTTLFISNDVNPSFDEYICPEEAYNQM